MTQSPDPQPETLLTTTRLSGMFFHMRDTASRLPDDLLLLAARVFPAAVFWQSGRTKMSGWNVSDNAVFLFQEEYRLPVIDPSLAAHFAAYAEHILPLLLILGLCTRFAATGMLVMTLTIQLLVYPDAWPTHGTWAVALLLLVSRGPGRWSADSYLFAAKQ